MHGKGCNFNVQHACISKQRKVCTILIIITQIVLLDVGTKRACTYLILSIHKKFKKYLIILNI